MPSNISVSSFLPLHSPKLLANLSTAQAQEQDALSDADFESDDELDNAPISENGSDTNGDASDGESEPGRPAKKQRSS